MTDAVVSISFFFLPALLLSIFLADIHRRVKELEAPEGECRNGRPIVYADGVTYLRKS